MSNSSPTTTTSSNGSNSSCLGIRSINTNFWPPVYTVRCISPLPYHTYPLHPSNNNLTPLLPELLHNKSIPSISSPSFFNGFTITPSPTDDFTYTPLQPSTLPPTIDKVAKIFYSVLLADLGQSVPTVVNDRDLLVEWTDELMKEIDNVTVTANLDPDDWTILEFWKNATAEMAVTPVGGGNESTIYTQYTWFVLLPCVVSLLFFVLFAFLLRFFCSFGSEWFGWSDPR